MEFVTIYIVGSNLLARIINSRAFDSCINYKVLEDFRDIYSCLEAMKTKRADLIIIESDLSDFQEIELIKSLNEQYPSVKIIVKTNQRNKEIMLLTLSSGVSGYVTDNNTDIRKVADIICKGGFWLDFNIAKNIFTSISNFNFIANEKSKENKRLKNSLTQRELEVLKLITEGKTNSQIAREIIVSTNTAKAHVGSILTKLSVSDRVQAAVKAIKANLF